MFIVVAYDISDDKTRTRLHKTLRRFGERVQFSVFECILTSEMFEQMRGEVAAALEHQELRCVRYYEICEGCRRRTVTLGQAFTTTIERSYIV
ncbi:MAG: CRISPR-associated endonuclease Cas2 [Blastocatellia bacterium]